MNKITKANWERLAELATELEEGLNEFKEICRRSMSQQEYQQFKYRTLGHCEPAISTSQEWVVSSCDTLAEVVERLEDELEEKDTEEEQE